MTAPSSRLIIFDTTLRDGEQSPGASMTRDEKLRIATMLEKMRVDVIEAGFAAASGGDFEAINAIARTVRESTVCSLARALKNDIEAAAGALQGAERPRIHTFIATSPIHMMHKLKMEPNAVLEQAERAVKVARQHTDDVEFSCEDAGRSELDFLCRIIEVAIDAGATTINIPDTVGYAVPEAFGEMLRNIIERVPNSDKAIFSVHCHNDLGLAVSNSLAAVINGARQVECTVNGLGERAGNAALEEVVMAVRTRQDLFRVDTNIDTRQIVPASRLVASVTGFAVQPNKAIVGANAFAHESGIHQDGVLKHRETYEIMSAEDVGWVTNRMVLGKHSGRNAFRSRLVDLGYTFTSDTDLVESFNRFKTLADKKHDIYDEDLHALMAETAQALDDAPDFIRLRHMSCNSETGTTPKARVVLDIEDKPAEAEAEGDGPVDACFKAVDSLVKSGTTLQLYSVNAISAGTEAQGEVTVRLEKGGRIVNGSGNDTDIVVASVKAYIKALNLMMNSPQRAHPQITV